MIISNEGYLSSFGHQLSICDFSAVHRIIDKETYEVLAQQLLRYGKLKRDSDLQICIDVLRSIGKAPNLSISKSDMAITSTEEAHKHNQSLPLCALVHCT